MKSVLAKKSQYLKLALFLFLIALIIRLLFAWFLPNDEPGDGPVYSQIAENILNHGVYSTSQTAPYTPTYIRAPGYPLFLASIYAIFGQENNTAVRLIQALIDSLTCGLIAWLAIIWLPESWHKKKPLTGLIALGIAAISPFVLIYVTTILTEVLTVFLLVLFAILISLFIKQISHLKNIWLLIAAGLVGGLMTLIRPDSGFFVLTGGLILIPTILKSSGSKLVIFKRMLLFGSLFTVSFLIVLLPWIIRNWRVFHIFMPLAPYSASMPEDFYASGYDKWLRTWTKNDDYIDYDQWSLDTDNINTDGLPDYAFGSDTERMRVQKLFDVYNNPDNSEDDDNQVYLTPALDAQFAQIAQERIAGNPLKFYLVLPIERAGALWFDTHSQFYSFSGSLFPLKNLNPDNNQQWWLPIFFLLVCLLTIGAIIGSIILWQFNSSKLPVIFVWTLILPRLIFLATLSHPEPRYTVEYFPLLIGLSAIAIVAGRKLYSK
jgi:hypothetical protein